MRLEFHQLERRWEHLRVRAPHRQAHLLASLAEHGQQTPIIVVAAADQPGRYVVIDGYARIEALQQLKHDTVEAAVWEMREAEAVVLNGTLHYGPAETALEQGWLLAELQRRFGYAQQELARRFDRSASWVSRRLAVAEVLPDAIQQHVREGRIAAQVALRYLIPAARVSVEDCQKLAAAFIECHCDARHAGELYAAWKNGSRAARERILSEPALYLKTLQEPPPPAKTPAAELERDLAKAVAILDRAERKLTAALPDMNSPQLDALQGQLAKAQRQLERLKQEIGKERETRHAESRPASGDSGTESQGSGIARDRARARVIPLERAQGAEGELGGAAGDRARGESGTLPFPDPGVVGGVQGEPRASP